MRALSEISLCIIFLLFTIKWNLDEEFLGIDNNVTAIDGRQMVKSKRIPHQPPYYGRQSFYQTFVGYLNYFHMNGTACLLRTICEIASSNLDENNGVLGSIFKILFMYVITKISRHANTHSQMQSVQTQYKWNVLNL